MGVVQSRRCTRVSVLLATALTLTQLAGVARAEAPSPTFQRNWQAGSPVSVEGVVTVMYGDDFQHRRADLIYSLRDQHTGESVRLRFEGAAPRLLRTGAHVTVHGRRLGKEIYLAAADGTGVTVQSLPPSSPSTVSGDQNTLVIIANFRDASVACTPAAISDLLFQGVAGPCVDMLYRQTSLGNISFFGQVVGPYEIPFDQSSACDLSAWGNAAETQAAAAGIDPAAYSRRVYVMPVNACPGAGFATIGGAPSFAWVFTCDLAGVYAHELGHNLGMDHAGTPTSEYGDSTDPMGFGSPQLRPLNAAHRHQMGWLGEQGRTFDHTERRL
jgi:hypothetical protein